MREAKNYTLLPILVLVRRELVRFFRQRSRVIGAIASPLIFWFLLGSGLGKSFHAAGAPVDTGYLEYFYPGTLALMILFTAIFSTISVIEDRNEGFLQSVLVAPVTRGGIVASKVIGGTLLSLIQGLFLLALAPLVGYHLSLAGVGLAVLTMALMGLTLTALGFVFAWSLNSVQGFHSIMNIVLFPMWLLSGALFPYSEAPLWLKGLMAVNPLTYGVSLLRTALSPDQASIAPGLPSSGVSLLLIIGFGILFYIVAAVVVGRRSKEVSV